jgi:hypothetical protein
MPTLSILMLFALAALELTFFFAQGNIDILTSPIHRSLNQCEVYLGGAAVRYSVFLSLYSS